MLTHFCLAGLVVGFACAAQAGPDSGLPDYQNSALPVSARVDDLLSRMSLEEKAGQMYHGRTGPKNTSLGSETHDQITENFITHYVYSNGINNVTEFVSWFNDIQQVAQNTRLGIPVTISTDPQHGWTQDGATSNVGLSFSRWPEPMGLAALRSPSMARTYANIVRQELAAVGIRQVLYPQVDIASEPRWGRVGLTLGEDANLTTSMLLGMIDGFKASNALESVIPTIKHFPGGGPVRDGEDPHFPWGKYQVYPGRHEDHHLIPFRAAIDAGAQQIMPYYSLPDSDRWDEIGFAFNKEVITGLLREDLGFDGIVLTDFGILTLTPWGVEDFSVSQRTKLAIDAGCDIIGGETSTETLVQLVKSGEINESRLDISVYKLMKQKFELGLFDQPFVDLQSAQYIVGREEFRHLGDDTQRRAFTLLTNKDNILPLHQSAKNAKFYMEGIDKTVAGKRGMTVVSKPEEADFALLRLSSPTNPPDPRFPATLSINNGSLSYNSSELSRQEQIYSKVETFVDIKMNRPAVVPELAEGASALFASYGSSPDAFLDVIFGISKPEGKLPFDMPRSMAAVQASFEDVPFDTEDPLFLFGHGLSYTPRPCLPRLHSIK